MKQFYLIIILVFGFQFGFCQIEFQDHNIELNDINLPVAVFSADLDGDGDMDLIAATQGDDKISWYENTDGQGTFGQQNIITTNADGVISIFSTDLDGDNDMDILFSTLNDGKLGWYENTDGLGTFNVEHLLRSNTLNSISSVYSTDIDGDGDMDIIAPVRILGSDSEISWHENLDGQGTFGTQQIITTDVGYPNSAMAADLDGDGDTDVAYIAGTSGSISGRISWQENLDGLGTFGPQIILLENPFLTDLILADVNNDNDIDIIYNNFLDKTINLFDNSDGQGTFNAEQVIISDNDLSEAKSVIASDIDNDGDVDIVASYYNIGLGESRIVWYENSNGLFGTRQIISTEVQVPRSVFAIDIDGDSDIDLFSGSGNTGSYELAWHENIETIGVEDIDYKTVKLYPNPVKDLLWINSSKSIESVKIFNNIGQILYLSTYTNYINLSNFNSGIYIIELKFFDQSQSGIRKKIIKQ